MDKPLPQIPLKPKSGNYPSQLTNYFSKGVETVAVLATTLLLRGCSSPWEIAYIIWIFVQTSMVWHQWYAAFLHAVKLIFDENIESFRSYHQLFSHNSVLLEIDCTTGNTTSATLFLVSKVRIRHLINRVEKFSALI